ncbi:MAG: ATP-binding cassette domain-containing protein, partial [Clostridia bacterium]|nr:ATP-binding cassette domain-containing protein [Clostridia bacterium]
LHCLDYRGIEIVKGLNLQVRRGEIVGIAGIDGNGQTELVEVITGLRKGTSGQVLVNGGDVFNKSPSYGFNHGVSSIPADRQKHGLVLDFSVEDNLILQNYEKHPFAEKNVLQREPIFAHATQSSGTHWIISPSSPTMKCAEAETP